MARPIRLKRKLTKNNIKSYVMIGVPVDDRKLYCWGEWVNSVKAIEKVDEIVVCDTSKNKLMKQKILDEGFTYIHCWEEKAMDRVVRARNLLREYSIDHDFKWLLYIDADIICQPDTAIKLKSHKADVVTGLGIIMDSSGLPIPSAKYLKDGNYYAFPAEKLDGNTYEVDLIGLGICMIYHTIFNRFLIRCERDKKGKLTNSEDCCFSMDCKSNNIKLLFDTSVVTQHKISSQGHWDWELA